MGGGMGGMGGGMGGMGRHDVDPGRRTSRFRRYFRAKKKQLSRATAGFDDSQNPRQTKGQSGASPAGPFSSTAKPFDQSEPTVRTKKPTASQDGGPMVRPAPPGSRSGLIPIGPGSVVMPKGAARPIRMRSG